jgi:ATP-binding cassette subfamily B protein
LRKRICFLPQELVIFEDSVFENVRLGDPDIGRAVVLEALEKVGAGPLLRRLPSGADTRLSRGAPMVSAGERQLLGLARALVRPADVIILDEPTASVDPVTEDRILLAFEEVVRGRISITIAHRGTTIGRADRVLFLEDGRIRGEGTPSEIRRRWIGVQTNLEEETAPPF